MQCELLSRSSRTKFLLIKDAWGYREQPELWLVRVGWVAEGEAQCTSGRGILQFWGPYFLDLWNCVISVGEQYLNLEWWLCIISRDSNSRLECNSQILMPLNKWETIHREEESWRDSPWKARITNRVCTVRLDSYLDPTSLFFLYPFHFCQWHVGEWSGISTHKSNWMLSCFMLVLIYEVDYLLFKLLI